MNGKSSIVIRISLKIVPKVPIDNKSAWFRKWLGAELTTSHYLNQCWPSSLTNICGFRGNELTLCGVNIEVAIKWQPFVDCTPMPYDIMATWRDFSSPVAAQEVDKITTYGATCDEKVIKMTFVFQGIWIMNDVANCWKYDKTILYKTKLCRYPLDHMVSVTYLQYQRSLSTQSVYVPVTLSMWRVYGESQARVWVSCYVVRYCVTAFIGLFTKTTEISNASS